MLFICEKPSQAKQISLALSKKCIHKNGYYLGEDNKIYTYTFGHLTEFKKPSEIDKNIKWNESSIPFFFKEIPIKLIDKNNIKNQFNIIKNLFENENEEIYVATDSGREGEYIFRTVYELIDIKKKFKRLWLKDMTKDGIIESFKNAKEGSHYDSLALSAKMRAYADYLIGMNATMLATSIFKNNNYKNNILSLGRVQTPTLCMIVERDLTIDNFKENKYYTLYYKLENNINFEINLNEDIKFTKEKADTLLKEIKKHKIQNLNFKTKQIKEKPPLLYDLTELQKDCNIKYNYTAEKTLTITQKLYEKQYITYPRTSSRYLSSDNNVYNILKKLNNNFAKKAANNNYIINKYVVNKKKVTDHEGLTPTTNFPKNLTKEEQNIYDLIMKSFISLFYEDTIKKNTKATITQDIYEFISTETIITKLGWREIYCEEIQSSKLKYVKIKDFKELEIKEIITRPPRKYTESSLLSDMKNCYKLLEKNDEKKILKECEGLGTAATRANIIETLISREYIKREKKNNKEYLISTEKGRMLYNLIEGDIKTPKMTVLLEEQLDKIQYNKLDIKIFLDNLNNWIKIFSNQLKITCFNCENNVYENKYNYYCLNKNCNLIIWKNCLQNMNINVLDRKIIKEIFENGKTKNKIKLYSKLQNKYFDVFLFLDVNKNKICFEY